MFYYVLIPGDLHFVRGCLCFSSITVILYLFLLSKYQPLSKNRPCWETLRNMNVTKSLLVSFLQCDLLLKCGPRHTNLSFVRLADLNGSDFDHMCDHIQFSHDDSEMAFGESTSPVAQKQCHINCNLRFSQKWTFISIFHYIILRCVCPVWYAIAIFV